MTLTATYTTEAVHNADYTNINGYATFAEAQAACDASASCKGIWQRNGSLQYVLLDRVGGTRSWTGTDHRAEAWGGVGWVEVVLVSGLYRGWQRRL